MPSQLKRLPAPDPAFRWSDGLWGPFLRCEPLDSIAQHAFTSKQPGLSPEESDRPEPWTVAAKTVGVRLDRVMRIKQVHGNQVRRVLSTQAGATAGADRPDADAIVSNVAGLALVVSVADCVPILIADARSRAAAAIHAGWRGMCARVIAAAVEVLQRDCGTNPAECVAAIGPSIGADDYEVGEELVEAFVASAHARADVDRWFRRTGARVTLDLWSAGRDQLASAGLQDRSIYACGLSTLAHRDVFESYRADRERAGRMAGLIVVPPR